MSDVTRPILRYHGGKFAIRKWITSFFPEHIRYLEPFCGAASVLMAKAPAYGEIIGDLDDRIVNLFRVLQDDELSERLRKLCYLTPFAREVFNGTYTEARTEVLNAQNPFDPVRQAHDLIVRSFFGYGCVSQTQNGFRSVRKDTNSPAVDWSRWPDHIPAFVERLRRVVVENMPALDLIERYDIEDGLIYCDPPYVHDTRTLHQGTYFHEMTDDDHRELAEKLHQCKSYVVISGYPSGLYNELFGDWPQFSRKAHADKAAERTEVVWLSPRTADALELERAKKVLPLLAGGIL